MTQIQRNYDSGLQRTVMLPTPYVESSSKAYMYRLAEEIRLMQLDLDETHENLRASESRDEARRSRRVKRMSRKCASATQTSPSQPIRTRLRPKSVSCHGMPPKDKGQRKASSTDKSSMYSIPRGGKRVRSRTRSISSTRNLDLNNGSLVSTSTGVYNEDNNTHNLHTDSIQRIEISKDDNNNDNDDDDDDHSVEGSEWTDEEEGEKVYVPNVDNYTQTPPFNPFLHGQFSDSYKSTERKTRRIPINPIHNAVLQQNTDTSYNGEETNNNIISPFHRQDCDDYKTSRKTEVVEQPDIGLEPAGTSFERNNNRKSLEVVMAEQNSYFADYNWPVKTFMKAKNEKRFTSRTIVTRDYRIMKCNYSGGVIDSPPGDFNTENNTTKKGGGLFLINEPTLERSVREKDHGDVDNVYNKWQHLQTMARKDAHDRGVAMSVREPQLLSANDNDKRDQCLNVDRGDDSSIMKMHRENECGNNNNHFQYNLGFYKTSLNGEKVNVTKTVKGKFRDHNLFDLEGENVSFVQSKRVPDDNMITHCLPTKDTQKMNFKNDSKAVTTYKKSNYIPQNYADKSENNFTYKLVMHRTVNDKVLELEAKQNTFHAIIGTDVSQMTNRRCKPTPSEEDNTDKDTNGSIDNTISNSNSFNTATTYESHTSSNNSNNNNDDDHNTNNNYTNDNASSSNQYEDATGGENYDSPSTQETCATSGGEITVNDGTENSCSFVDRSIELEPSQQVYNYNDDDLGGNSNASASRKRRGDNKPTRNQQRGSNIMDGKTHGALENELKGLISEYDVEKHQSTDERREEPTVFTGVGISGRADVVCDRNSSKIIQGESRMCHPCVTFTNNTSVRQNQCEQQQQQQQQQPSSSQFFNTKLDSPNNEYVEGNQQNNGNIQKMYPPINPHQKGMVYAPTTENYWSQTNTAAQPILFSPPISQHNVQQHSQINSTNSNCDIYKRINSSIAESENKMADCLTNVSSLLNNRLDSLETMLKRRLDETVSTMKQICRKRSKIDNDSSSEADSQIGNNRITYASQPNLVSSTGFYPNYQRSEDNYSNVFSGNNSQSAQIHKDATPNNNYYDDGFGTGVEQLAKSTTATKTTTSRKARSSTTNKAKKTRRRRKRSSRSSKRTRGRRRNTSSKAGRKRAGRKPAKTNSKASAVSLKYRKKEHTRRCRLRRHTNCGDTCNLCVLNLADKVKKRRQRKKNVRQSKENKSPRVRRKQTTTKKQRKTRTKSVSTEKVKQPRYMVAQSLLKDKSYLNKSNCAVKRKPRAKAIGKSDDKPVMRRNKLKFDNLCNSKQKFVLTDRGYKNMALKMTKRNKDALMCDLACNISQRSLIKNMSIEEIRSQVLERFNSLLSNTSDERVNNFYNILFPEKYGSKNKTSNKATGNRPVEFQTPNETSRSNRGVYRDGTFVRHVNSMELIRRRLNSQNNWMRVEHQRSGDAVNHLVSNNCVRSSSHSDSNVDATHVMQDINFSHKNKTKDERQMANSNLCLSKGTRGHYYHITSSSSPARASEKLNNNSSDFSNQFQATSKDVCSVHDYQKLNKRMDNSVASIARDSMKTNNEKIDTETVPIHDSNSDASSNRMEDATANNNAYETLSFLWTNPSLPQLARSNSNNIISTSSEEDRKRLVNREGAFEIMSSSFYDNDVQRGNYNNLTPTLVLRNELKDHQNISATQRSINSRDACACNNTIGSSGFKSDRSCDVHDNSTSRLNDSATENNVNFSHCCASVSMNVSLPIFHHATPSKQIQHGKSIVLESPPKEKLNNNMFSGEKKILTDLVRDKIFAQPMEFQTNKEQHHSKTTTQCVSTCNNITNDYEGNFISSNRLKLNVCVRYRSYVNQASRYSSDFATKIASSKITRNNSNCQIAKDIHHGIADSMPCNDNNKRDSELNMDIEIENDNAGDDSTIKQTTNPYLRSSSSSSSSSDNAETQIPKPETNQTVNTVISCFSGTGCIGVGIGDREKTDSNSNDHEITKHSTLSQADSDSGNDNDNDKMPSSWLTTIPYLSVRTPGLSTRWTISTDIRRKHQKISNNAKGNNINNAQIQSSENNHNDKSPSNDNDTHNKTTTVHEPKILASTSSYNNHNTIISNSISLKSQAQPQQSSQRNNASSFPSSLLISQTTSTKNTSASIKQNHANNNNNEHNNNITMLTETTNSDDNSNSRTSSDTSSTSTREATNTQNQDQNQGSPVSTEDTANSWLPSNNSHNGVNNNNTAVFTGNVASCFNKNATPFITKVKVKTEESFKIKDGGCSSKIKSRASVPTLLTAAQQSGSVKNSASRSKLNGYCHAVRKSHSMPTQLEEKQSPAVTSTTEGRILRKRKSVKAAVTSIILDGVPKKKRRLVHASKSACSHKSSYKRHARENIRRFRRELMREKLFKTQKLEKKNHNKDNEEKHLKLGHTSRHLSYWNSPSSDADSESGQ